MSIKVKGFLKDVGGASRVTELRKKSIETASAVPDPVDNIRAVADAHIPTTWSSGSPPSGRPLPRPGFTAWSPPTGTFPSSRPGSM